MTEYRILRLEDLPSDMVDDWELRYSNGFKQTLVKYVDGEPVERIYTDGGEPEDMTLSRNLYVFVEELNKAVQ